MGSKKNNSKETRNNSSRFTSFKDFAISQGIDSPDEQETAPEPIQASSIAYAVNPDYYFINPYTFVPISSEEPKREKVKRGTHTGVIECELEIQEGHPLFIPNAHKIWKVKDDHMIYDFYSYDDLSEEVDLPDNPPKNPIIPGSEIRGMVRNVYEQLTNSCFLVVDENNLPFKRSALPKDAGILDKETKRLFKANRYMLNTYGRSEFGEKVSKTKYKTGDHVYFKPTEATYGETCGKKYIKNKGVENIKHSETKLEGWLEGYVLIGEKFSRKHHDSVMFKGSDSWDVKEHIQRFEDVLERYDEYDDYKNAYNNPNKRFIPVFYKKLGDVFYMSPAQITKEVFENTINKLLNTDENSHHQPCNSRENACPACRLFGMISKNIKYGTIDKGGAIRGRVRFADATAAETINAENFSWHTLPILATPHLSATEFYLKRPQKVGNDVTWNYDYYTAYDKNKNDPYSKLITKPSVTYTPALAGRKVYWHGEFNKEPSEQVKMNQTVRLLNKGKFKFNVYFEDLTLEELSDLKFAIDLSTKGNIQCLHKIGHGKPVGMGDVKVSISSIQERTYEVNPETGLITVGLKVNEDIPYTKEETKYIRRYTKPMGGGNAELVAYPSKKGSNEVYKWFASNRGKSIQQPAIEQTLPDIMDEQKLEK